MWGLEKVEATRSLWKTYEQASKVAMELEEEERVKNRAIWNDWADEAVERGAKIAHAATKEAKQVVVLVQVAKGP